MERVMFRKTHGLEGDVQELYIPGKASLTYQEEDGMAILIKVETEEAQRNKGYASRLLKEFLAYADQEGLALDVSGYLPDGELYLKPLMSKLKPNYPGITWLNESKENTMRKLRETTGLPHYAKGVRRVVDGVVDEIAGLDHDMAVLCLAIWNLKLERTEEDPTEDLIDLWNSGKGNYCLSDGRRPGPKEAAALKALLAEFNDIIADHEENLRESFGMRPHKAAFCRDANNKRLVPGNNVNTPDGEGEIDKISGTRGEYFVSVNGQEYRSTECHKLHEAKARDSIANIVESESWLINGNSDKIIKKQYEDELKSLASSIKYCKNAIAQKDIETWEKKEYQSVLTDYESREKDIKNILKGMK